MLLSLPTTTKASFNMKRKLIVLFLATIISSKAEKEAPFRLLFDAVVEERLDLAFFHDCPYAPSLYLRTPANAQMWNAIDSMSNHVDDAVLILPYIVTNDLRRNIFLNMAGHAGTNAFLRVWDGVLDMAETNALAVSPQQIDDFNSAAASPLENYPVFFYDLPMVQSLLTRTRNLFPSQSEEWDWYNKTLTGVTKAEFLIYAEESGEGLPPCAR